MELSTPHHPHRRTPSYIGDSDWDVLAFIRNLAQAIETRGPSAFRLGQDDLDQIIAARDLYAESYTRAKSNISRTRPAVLLKNELRDAADRISRRYAQIIKNQPPHVVPDDLKVVAGVPVEVETRASTGRPGSFPVLHIAHAGPPELVPRLKVRFHDSALGRGRLPRESGITHMILHAEIAPRGEYTMKASAQRVVAFVTRNPYRLTIDRQLMERFGLVAGLDHSNPAVLPCLGVMLRGRWLNAKGEVGPMGPAAMIKVAIRGDGVAHAGSEGDGVETADSESLQLAA